MGCFIALPMTQLCSSLLDRHICTTTGRIYEATAGILKHVLQSGRSYRAKNSLYTVVIKCKAIKPLNVNTKNKY